MTNENVTNEEVLNEVEEQEINLMDRKPLPSIKYGTPQLFCIERVVKRGKVSIVKGKDEHTPDSTKNTEWYAITGHLVSLEYGTTGKPFSINVWENTLNRINEIVLEQNTYIISVVFSFHTFEYDEKDKNGQPTGNRVQGTANEIVTANPLTPEECRVIRSMMSQKKK